MPTNPRILVRSGWQTVNIGDMAHTPGLLSLLEEYLPDAEVFLLPTVLSAEVEAMILRRFPRLRVVRTEAEVAKAFRDCDFLLHGSGGCLVGWRDVLRWVDETGKPFGVCGVSFGFDPENRVNPPGDNPYCRQLIDLYNRARFVYFRDSVSLGRARTLGAACPVMEFGPDAAFATDLRDDPAAASFLRHHGLEENRFVCCIPRLRYTPYWLMKEGYPLHAERHARNEEMKEHDNAPLREAVVRLVRETGYRVLLVPEDSSQMAVGREMIFDRLPPDVKERVVWRENFWLTDEALSTFVRSAGLFSSDMHSPIMCVGNGVPAIVCRWAEQTTKGFMWRDIGLGDWLFDFDRENEAAALPEAAVRMVTEREAAIQATGRAREFVRLRQREIMDVLRRSLT